jgi:hypothetical protein
VDLSHYGLTCPLSALKRTSLPACGTSEKCQELTFADHDRDAAQSNYDGAALRHAKLYGNGRWGTRMPGNAGWSPGAAARPDVSAYGRLVLGPEMIMGLGDLTDPPVQRVPSRRIDR